MIASCAANRLVKQSDAVKVQIQSFPRNVLQLGPYGTETHHALTCREEVDA
jgi:hypothetical protein